MIFLFWNESDDYRVEKWSRFFFFFLQREYFDSKIGDKNKRGPRFPLVYDRTKCETSPSPFWVKKLRFRLRSTIREKEKRPRRFKFRSGDAIFLLNTGAKVESFGYRDEDKFVRKTLPRKNRADIQRKLLNEMFVIGKVLANRENKTEFTRKCENFFLYDSIFSMGTFLKLATRWLVKSIYSTIIPNEV